MFPLEVEGQCNQGLHKSVWYLLARLPAASWACSLERRALLGGGRGRGVPPELMSPASTFGCPPLLRKDVAWLCIEFPLSRQCAPGSELGNPSLEVGQGITQSGKKTRLGWRREGDLGAAGVPSVLSMFGGLDQGVLSREC